MSGNGLVACGMVFHGMTSHVETIAEMLSKLDIPLDSQDIVSKNDEGFSIDMNNMERLKPYMMTFEGSKYVLWKTGNDALVIREVR